jgi:hypothetical protein
MSYKHVTNICFSNNINNKHVTNYKESSFVVPFSPFLYLNRKKKKKNNEHANAFLIAMSHKLEKI